MSKIKSIHARQILDSRGNPTIEVDLTLENKMIARASVPSGASTGSREALELRDADKNYFLGKSVLKAIKNVNEIIAPKLIGMDVLNLNEIDKIMLHLDGTPFKSNLGANATLSVSMAATYAGAMYLNKPLFKYLREDLKAPNKKGAYVLPTPLMNIINGGEHASNNLDIQEFMITPHLKKSFSENLRAGVEIFHHLKKVLSDKGYETNVGDEGGFAPNLHSHEEALDLISLAIKNAGYKVGSEISFSLDSASSEFYKNNIYKMEGRDYSTQEMITYYENLMNEYPLYSIEDGLAEGDHEGWRDLTSALGKKVTLVGDDLFVTNPKIFKEGILNKEGNAILIKINQIGTISETLEAIELAYENNYKAIISHRSGETTDTFISHLAVATASSHIKTGSLSRMDRIEKYNELLRIEEALGSEARFDPVK